MVTKKYTLSLLYEIDDVEQTKTKLFEYEVDLSAINPTTLVETLLGLIPAGVSTQIQSLSSMGGFVETLLLRAGLI